MDFNLLKGGMDAMGKVVKGKWKEAVPKARPKVKKDENQGRVYQLKISITGSKPEIWRRILVSGNTNLAKLHNIIQELIGWEDDHLHEFVVAGVHYTMPLPGDLVPSQDEKRFRLYEVAAKQGLKFFYIYDFGDDWHHEIIIEKSNTFFFRVFKRLLLTHHIADSGACPREIFIYHFAI